MKKRIIVMVLLAGSFLFAVNAAAQTAERTYHTVQNGRIKLEAMLVVPAGGAAAKAAVVFVGGSGASNVLDYAAGFTDRLIESIYLPRDIAVFYLNKRGTGKSMGNWKFGSIEQQAYDLLAAVRYLRDLPVIDADRVGIAGHSQGGWVVQLAGSLDPRVAFVVSMAGPSVMVREHDLKRVEIQLHCEGVEGEELNKKVEKRDRAHNIMIFVGKWFPFFELRLMSNILPFDPAPALKTLTQPVLLAFAELDSMVPPDQNLGRLNEIFPNGLPSNMTQFTTPKADHLFHITDTICFDYEASLAKPYSEEYRRFLAAWIDENVAD
ncbi:MAG: alpha/beta fold hydrolase [Spirochaetales bacterium]|nr:MAG: alpha/beta fold hydrolase [Spirochaetales bacterium]